MDAVVPEPLWADVHPTGHGRIRLGYLGLPISGRDLLARIEPNSLLVGEHDVLYQLAANDVFAVHWQTTDDDLDALPRALQLDPAAWPSCLLELAFDPQAEGIEGVKPGEQYPVCWLHDWLCVQGTLCRLVSFPHHWVVGHEGLAAA
jgi:hypothetical protein